MGPTISKLFDAFYGSTPKKILLLGLDAAGKTTILYKMNLGETVHTIPTVGFNVETIKYKHIDLNCWDIGGQKKIRSLWHHYYEGADAIIFCVDANDPERMGEVQEELYALLDNDRLKNASLLIYANKQDLPNAMSTAAVVDKLELSSRQRHRRWHVQGAIATTGEGLYEGLDWLSDAIRSSTTHGH